MTKRTIIIIGAGHNGLICATYLAKAGHDVTILEARNKVGGSIATREFAKGFKVPGLAHLSYPLHSKIVGELGLKLTTGSPVETISLDADGNHLILGSNQVSGSNLSTTDKQAYAAFKKEFSSYAKALTPLMLNKPPRLKDMDRKDKMTLAKIGWKLRFGLGTDSLRDFLRVGGINIYDVLNEEFESEALKGAIAFDACLGHHMGPRTPTTVLTYVQRLFGETEKGQLTKLTPGLCTALQARAEQAGVRIQTRAKVENIIVNDGRATSVRLAGGEEMEADLVISNADAKSTFLHMVGAPKLDAMFTHRISKTRTNGDVAKLHLALSGLPDFNGLSADQLRNRLIIAPDMRYIEHAFNPSKYGEFSQSPILEISMPSLDDPSLAPNGKHLMSINASYAPYKLKNGWNKKNKDQFAKAVIDLLTQYAPGLSKLVLEKELLTPADIESEYHVRGGHWHHGEMTIDQSFMMRPVHGAAQYDTPITGLFLCGASAHPGGGITGLPGRNAARRILSMAKVGEL